MKKGIGLNLKGFGVFLISLFLIYSCSSDDDGFQGSDFDGSYAAIEQLIGSSVLDSLSNLGMVINRGAMPPNIEGKYLFSPAILDTSSVSGDIIGEVYNDADLEFSEQDNINLTIVFDGIEAMGHEHSGSGGFISGDGDYFSVFLINESDFDGYIGETIFVVSAKKLEDGLTNFQLAFYMVDNGGNPATIPNGSGRIFVDGDDFVEKID